MYKNKEITSKMYLEKNLIFDDEICFSIAKNNYSNNYIKIYNDDNLYRNFKIENESDYFHDCFNENGNYKIYIESVEIPFKYKGKLIYDFRIDKKGISGGIVFVIIIGILLLFGLGFGGVLYYRRKKRNSMDYLLNEIEK